MNNVIILLCLTITITSSQNVRWRGERTEIIQYYDQYYLTCRTPLFFCNKEPELVSKEFLNNRIRAQQAQAQALTTQAPKLSDRFPSEANEPTVAPQDPTQFYSNKNQQNVPQAVQQRVTTTRRPQTYQPSTPNDRVANGILQLGINIFGLTSSSNNDDIQVISPVSIAEATSLIQLGAKGQTLAELLKLNGQTEESN